MADKEEHTWIDLNDYKNFEKIDIDEVAEEENYDEAEGEEEKEADEIMNYFSYLEGNYNLDDKRKNEEEPNRMENMGVIKSKKR